jgi:hypothetical protein
MLLEVFSTPARAFGELRLDGVLGNLEFSRDLLV